MFATIEFEIFDFSAKNRNANLWNQVRVLRTCKVPLRDLKI